VLDALLGIVSNQVQFTSSQDSGASNSAWVTVSTGYTLFLPLVSRN
jgi:hypothetical protein